MKAIIRHGYRDYILDSYKAIAILNLLEGAEIYEHVYHPKEGDKDSYYTYHIYPNEDRDAHLSLMPEEVYRMYKLAGKPEK